MAFEITDENLEELKSGNKIVLMDVWAPWCGPCRMLGPVIDDLAKENEGTEGVFIGKANIDETPDISEEYKIRSVPTVIIFKDGEEVEKITGAHPKKRYQDLIEKYSSDEFDSEDGEDF